MKVLGTVQFQQKTFKLLNYVGKFMRTLGNIPAAFMMVIYGESGNGKTEACIQLAKELTRYYKKVAWISYEQGHGFDLQTAINRNMMEEVAGKFLIIDPSLNRQRKYPNEPGNLEMKSFFEELCDFLSKKGSPPVVFIDSLDYLRLTWEQYVYLKETFGSKKTIIFIAHASGSKPKLRITEQIYYDGGFAFLVKKYIMYVMKNRFGGFDPYVIWEDKARELNPKFFNN